jgi:hypothetical protein
VSQQSKIILGGVGAVIGYDLLASLASRSLGFPYASASVGSYILYLLIGFVAARHASVAPIRHAAVAAGIAGLADASVGWAISWALGPGRLPAGIQMTAAQRVITALIVGAVAAGLGALAGVLGRRRQAPRAAAPLPRAKPRAYRKDDALDPRKDRD